MTGSSERQSRVYCAICKAPLTWTSAGWHCPNCGYPPDQKPDHWVTFHYTGEGWIVELHAVTLSDEASIVKLIEGLSAVLPFMIRKKEHKDE